MGRLFTVVGIKYYDYESHKDMIQEGDIVYLEPEPENKFDKNATVVYFPFDNLKIGYVSAKETDYLFDDLKNCTFKIHSFYKNVILIEENIITPFDFDKLKKSSNELLSQGEIEEASIIETVKNFFAKLKKR